MALELSPQVLAVRESLRQQFARYQAASGEPLTSGAGVTEWLLSQLPGTDPERLGWAVITVAGLLYPGLPVTGAPDGDRRKLAGQSTAMLVASRVGEALIDRAARATPAHPGISANPAAPAPPGTPAHPTAPAHSATAAHDDSRQGSVQVGRELSLIDLTEAYADLHLPAAPEASPQERRDELREQLAGDLAEIRATLTDGIPGIDLTAAGWALIGTGMSILVTTSKAPASRRRLARGRRKPPDEFKASATKSALLLAVTGDFLVNPD
jgi:hypothetical protein